MSRQDYYGDAAVTQAGLLVLVLLLVGLVGVGWVLWQVVRWVSCG